MSVTLKNRLKNYSFWVSLASAILLLVQAVGKPLGLVINEEIYMSIVNSVLGVFVVLGIISHPAQNLLSNKDEQNSSSETVVISNSSTQTEKIANVAENAEQNNTNVIHTDAADEKTQRSNANNEFQQNIELAEIKNSVKDENISSANYTANALDSNYNLQNNANNNTSDTYGTPYANTVNQMTESFSNILPQNNLNITETNAQTKASTQDREIIVNGVKLQTKQQGFKDNVTQNENANIAQYNNTQIDKSAENVFERVEQDNKSNSANC